MPLPEVFQVWFGGGAEPLKVKITSQMLGLGLVLFVEREEE